MWVIVANGEVSSDETESAPITLYIGHQFDPLVLLTFWSGTHAYEFLLLQAPLLEGLSGLDP